MSPCWSGRRNEGAGAPRVTTGRHGSVRAVLFDVVGIGNALVDVIAHADEGFLTEHALVK